MAKLSSRYVDIVGITTIHNFIRVEYVELIHRQFFQKIERGLENEVWRSCFDGSSVMVKECLVNELGDNTYYD